MDDGRKVQVKVGEFGLYGTAAHISVGFHDDEGINLPDVNGFPHSPNSGKETVVTLGILGREPK